MRFFYAKDRQFLVYDQGILDYFMSGWGKARADWRPVATSRVRLVAIRPGVALRHYWLTNWV